MESDEHGEVKMNIDTLFDKDMFTRKILYAWLLWVLILIFWFFQNELLPLGYDHGVYKHLINVLSMDQGITQLPEYLKYQFEPFSWVFFYSTTTFVGKDLFFSWGYLSVFLLIWISLFLLWKNKKTYTIGSYLGLFLFLFSSIQYLNLWWWFWKQMFAVLFFILFLRYKNKKIISWIFLAACIALHRLTWFVAIVYLVIDLFFSRKRNIHNLGPIFVWFLFGFIPYITSFNEQILPSITGIIHRTKNQFFISHPYWTGFSPVDFWWYLAPILFMSVFWYILFFYQKQGIKRYPYLFMVLFLIVLVSIRFMAYTRLWSFLDLFIIILLTKNLYHLFQKKWIYIFLLIQCITWFTFASKWHTPFISVQENKIIKNLIQNMPEKATPVALSASTMSMMTGHTAREIYSTRQWVSGKIWTKTEKNLMKSNKDALCKSLSKLPWEPFIYIGSYENFWSINENPCIRKVVEWENGSRLFLYLK